MEQESEKTEALKQAYAGMILNTSKEAAARIMVSERKALWFQRNVVSVKEEALNMLMRLKQVMDSKIADMEIVFLRQRVKIEELEAQLHEAEDVVTDLRAKLEDVQIELENIKDAQVKSFYEQTLKSSAASHENPSQANELDVSRAVSSPISIAGSGFEDASFDQRRNTDNCCFASKSVTIPTKLPDKFPEENYCAGNPDLASIIMASKEPELYRNGCTQRIRALERSHLDVDLHLPVQKDVQHSNIRSRSTVKENDIAEVNCNVASPGFAEKEPTGSIELLGQDGDSEKGQDVKFIRSISVKKSNSRYRNVPCANQVIQSCSASIHPKTYPCPGNSLEDSEDDPLMISEKEVPKDLESHLHSLSSWEKANTSTLSGTMYDLENGTESTKAMYANNTSHKKPLVNMSKSTRQDGDVAGCLDVPNCWQQYEAFDQQAVSNSEDLKTCNTDDNATIQAVNDRLLKYTFQRKRKKGASSCPSESNCQEENTVKKISGEKQIGDLDSHRSSLVMESSRDSRRLGQVSCQLISLSEKRC